MNATHARKLIATTPVSMLASCRAPEPPPAQGTRATGTIAGATDHHETYRNVRVIPIPSV